MSTDCTQAELQKAADPNDYFSCLNRGQSVGLFVRFVVDLICYESGR
jgi:hypothetical protein